MGTYFIATYIYYIIHFVFYSSRVFFSLYCLSLSIPLNGCSAAIKMKENLFIYFPSISNCTQVSLLKSFSYCIVDFFSIYRSFFFFFYKLFSYFTSTTIPSIAILHISIAIYAFFSCIYHIHKKLKAK